MSIWRTFHHSLIFIHKTFVEGYIRRFFSQRTWSRWQAVLNVVLLCVLGLTLTRCGRQAPPATTESVVSESAISEIVISPQSEATAPEVKAGFIPAVVKPTQSSAILTEGRVDAALVNLRSGPGLENEMMGVARGDTRFQVLDVDPTGEWLLICCPIGTEILSWIKTDVVVLDDASIAAIQKLITENDIAQVTELVSEPVSNTLENQALDGSDETTEANPIIEVNPVAAVDTPLEPTGVVNANLVNVRGGPGTQYEVVGQVTAGTSFEILGSNEDQSWWRICCPAGTATESWIIAQFVDLTLPSGETAAAIPLAPIPAAPVVPTPEPAPVAVVSAGTGGAVTENRTSTAVQAAAPAPGIPGPGGFGNQGGTNPLTGLPMPAERANQRPIIVCINNDYAARPQFGISQADVMYEYVMEGYSITRYSGVYYGEEVAQIGPVRSARLINYYMGALYNAGLACSGASDGVRYKLKHEAPFPYMDVDLDDPSNTRYSVSIGSDYRTRLRTSTGQLRRWLADWHVEQTANIRGFTFGGLAGGGVSANTINIPYPSGTASHSSYRFDGSSGRYLRLLGDAAHLDGNSGGQVAFENVVIQYVPHEVTDIIEDSLGSRSIRLNLFGSGRSILFRDGQAFEGTWQSNSRGDTPRFFKQDGGEVALKPGKTWISVVPLNYTIGYQ